MADTNVIYAVTRVKARKSNLIPAEEYTRMLQMDGAVLARYIGDLGYGEEYTPLVGKVAEHELIERATLVSMAREFSQIVSFCKGDIRSEVEAYLGHIDMKNIIALMRVNEIGGGEDALRREMIPYGVWKEMDYREHVGRHDFVEVARRFTGGYWFSSILRKALDNPDVQTLGSFEDHITREYYARLVSVLKHGGFAEKHMVRYVRKEIDIQNMLTVIKLFGKVKDPEGLARRAYIEGGLNLDRKAFRDLFSLDDLGALSQAIFSLETFGDAEPAVAGEACDDPVMLARELTRARIALAGKFSHLYPLSVLPIIHYIIMKEREVENIRILTRGKERGLPRETIARLLVV